MTEAKDLSALGITSQDGLRGALRRSIYAHISRSACWYSTAFGSASEVRDHKSLQQLLVHPTASFAPARLAKIAATSAPPAALAHRSTSSACAPSASPTGTCGRPGPPQQSCDQELPITQVEEIEDQDSKVKCEGLHKSE